jgi:hypothetical protein
MGILVFLIFIAYLIFLTNKRIKAFFYLFITLPLITVFLVYILEPNLVLRFIDRFNSLSFDDLTSGRIEIFNTYNFIFFNNPKYWLFGVGIQNYTTKLSTDSAIHNAFQQIYVTWGLVGFFTSILWFYNFFRGLKIQSLPKFLIRFLPFVIFIIYVQSSRFFSLFSMMLIIVPIIGFSLNNELQNNELQSNTN